MTNRKMVNFQEWDVFLFFFLYTFTVNCVTTGAQKLSFEYMFCFIWSEQCTKIISSRKKCGLFSSVFKTIVPYNTTPTFKKWVG